MKTFRKRLRRSARAEVFQEYCANSSIHGVRYFSRDERTSCERFWWLVAFLLSMAGCGVMIYKTYVKWNEVPIIVTFSEKTTSAWDMQFPAITICPETKMSSEKLNFTAEINSLREMYLHTNTTPSDELAEQVKAVSQLCNDYFLSDNGFLKYINGTEDNIVGMLKNLSLERGQTVFSCTYGNRYTYCQHYMVETITEEGLCYTFNMMPESEIFRKSSLHTEYNYTEDWFHYTDDWYHYMNQTSDIVPLYGKGAGLHAGLSLYLKHTKKDTDYMCSGFSQGYKLMIHDPDEYPQVSMRNMRLPFGHEISIALKPQMIVTTKSAADYSWKKRQCFFNHERHLRFFKIYNQANCELECLTNVTLALCGCVRFSMPRANDTKMCPLSKWECMFHAKWILGLITEHHSLHKEITDIVNRCNCLPACRSVDYDVEITQTLRDIDNYLRANNELPQDISDKYLITTLAIYFKESYFITSKRSELYGWVDFLANCGGLLGLFMGVSILSLLEIFYFLTIRPFSVRKKARIAEQRKPHEVHNSLLAVVRKAD
uniref:Pickpocket n=1 Tax=Anopheles funestus TaxID=62324 RepID=A0A182RXW0_ANOFN